MKLTLDELRFDAILADLRDATRLTVDNRVASSICSAVANLIAALPYGGTDQGGAIARAKAFGFAASYYGGSIRVDWVDA